MKDRTRFKRYEGGDPLAPPKALPLFGIRLRRPPPRAGG